MDDISEMILGPQRSATGSKFDFVLAVIGIVLALALIVYFARCYVQESLMRRRIKKRVHQAQGGNIVMAEMICTVPPLSETRGIPKKLSRSLPPLRRENDSLKLRRSRRPHPWKHDRFRADSPTPH
jgi:hypothetical protein